MTLFEEVYKLFLFSLQDFEMSRLFRTDVECADDMLYTFMCRAIPLFTNCVKNLENIGQDSSGKYYFVEQLDLTEKNILSNLMVEKWLDFFISDSTQLGGLQDTDFKRESAANNLKEKANYADKWREKTNNMILQYGFKHTNFSEWANGNYGL